MLAFAIETAIHAGKSTLETFQKGNTITLKEDDSPVTAADQRAETLIRQAIAKKYPNHGIFGEEEGKSGSQSERWVIDPIDGTKSFVAGVPLYATLLSFEVDDEALVGVCYFPALNELLYAEKGGGCFWQDKSCQVIQKPDISQLVLSLGAPNILRRQGRLDSALELGEKFLAVRTWTDAYGHALVATGRIPAMLDPRVEPYDISALTLIIREAGGKCMNSAGQNPGPDAISICPELEEIVLTAMNP